MELWNEKVKNMKKIKFLESEDNKNQISHGLLS